MTNSFKIRSGVFHISSERFATFGENHNLVEAIVNFCAWLMNGAHNDNSFFFGNTNNLLHNVVSSSSVQAGGGLIQEKLQNEYADCKKSSLKQGTAPSILSLKNVCLPKWVV